MKFLANWTILLSFIVPSFGTVAFAQPSSEELTNDERELLKRGRIVTRRSPSLGHLYGGTSFQRINAPPDAVWTALLDTQRYEALLPNVTEARLIKRESEERIVYLRHGSGLTSIHYHLKLSPRPGDRTLRFIIDQQRSRSLKRGSGFITVRPYRLKQTLITFNVLADIGSGMISSLFRPQIQSGILRVPWNIKRYIEGSGRELYLGES